MFLISGEDDRSVPAKNIEASDNIFRHFNTGYLSYYNSGATGHNFGTDSPAMMLEFLYETLGYTNAFVSNIDTPLSGRAIDSGTFTTFDQREFFPDYDYETHESFVDRENGYLFVPNACADTTANCRVHFVLHGCGA